MTTYSYDLENRLISQNVDGNVTSFAYDGFGRKRRESRGVNPDVILNWDGDQMIVEPSDLDPEAPSKAYYVADGVIYAENANLGSRKSRRDYAVDYLGSVTGLTDIDSGISSVRRWSAYGKLLSGSSEPIGYFWTGNTGSRVYQSLGLNDNRARHYGRNIKQWITRDPLWPSELPYAYVGGNPVTSIDPSGYSKSSDFWACYNQYIKIMPRPKACRMCKSASGSNVRCDGDYFKEQPGDGPDCAKRYKGNYKIVYQGCYLACKMYTCAGLPKGLAQACDAMCKSNCKDATGGGRWPPYSICAGTGNTSDCQDCCQKVCGDTWLCLQQCDSCCGDKSTAQVACR
jgi:RHS repeat-associated protein